MKWKQKIGSKRRAREWKNVEQRAGNIKEQSEERGNCKRKVERKKR